MSQMLPALADFARQVDALRCVVQCFGEDACTQDEMDITLDLLELLKTIERLEAGLHMMHMRGARAADISAHLDSVDAGKVIWGEG